jgi:intraflagellar transport protein 172
MYTGLHMWEEALSLADAKGHPRLDDLKTTHAKWLLDTGQEEKAGAIKESEGDSTGALELYLQAGLATRASRLVKSDSVLLSSPDVVDRVSKALLRGEFYEQAGELFEKVDQEDQVIVVLY